MLHHMRLGERHLGPRIEVDDGDVHVVAQVGGVDEAGGRPVPLGVRHVRRRDRGIAGHQDLGRLEPRHRLIAFADPDAGGARRARPDRPVRRGGEVGEPALRHLVRRAVHRQGHPALQHEEHPLRLRVGFPGPRAAARPHLDDQLGKGLGKAGQRTGEDPGPRPLPPRQQAGGDVRLHPAGHEGVGVGKDRAPGDDVALRGQAAPVREVGAVHGSRSLRRCRAMRSTWAHAVLNSVARSLASRVSKARMMPALSWSLTAMMKGKPNFSV